MMVRMMLWMASPPFPCRLAHRRKPGPMRARMMGMGMRRGFWRMGSESQARRNPSSGFPRWRTGILRRGESDRRRDVRTRNAASPRGGCACSGGRHHSCRERRRGLLCADTVRIYSTYEGTARISMCMTCVYNP